MSVYELLSPQKVLYGSGSVAKVGAICKEYGNKALIVTGRNSAVANGSLDKVTASLQQEGIPYAWFNDLDPDPVMDSVIKGIEFGKKEKIDVIIALGGGSAIDTAKAIGVMMGNDGSLADYELTPPPFPGVPVIVIPTTAGTGSEATTGAVITNEEKMVKMCISSKHMIPKVAILDPELTITLPKNVTCATGMDALTHCIETYIATVSTPMSKPLSFEGIKLIAENFKKVIDSPEDLEARENMLKGSFYGGQAIANSATALVHAMSRPLGVYFHVSHGLANAILLTRVMEFNRSSVEEELALIAPAFGVNTVGLTMKEASIECIEAIRKLYDYTGLPKRLNEVGVKKELLPKLAHDAYVNRSNKINPRVATEEEILNMYLELF